jgi:hypothetical protein
MTESAVSTSSPRRLPLLANELGGIAIVGIATDASYGARLPPSVAIFASILQSRKEPLRAFLLHLHQRDTAENARRIDQLIERIRARGIREVVGDVSWVPQILERLEQASVRFTPMPLPDGPIRQVPDLPIEVIGMDANAGIANVDLVIGQQCSYQRPAAGDGFYAEVETKHVGCSYCLGAMGKVGDEGDLTARILERVQGFRAEFKGLKTVWVPFAETLFAELIGALEQARDTSLFHGIELAIQLRADVLVARSADVQAFGASAHAAGTHVRLALVGFENFSERELDILHRGVSVSDLQRAADILGRWRAQPPLGLELRAVVPSFILFNPWTRLEDIELSLRGIRENRLMFANIERLRISASMPIHVKLVEAGLSSDGPVSLEVHPNGYTDEVAYHFVDPRVAAASAGFATLKPLSMSDQPLLLEAVVRAVGQAPDPGAIDWGGIAARYREIEAALPQRDAAGTTNGARVTGIERVLKRFGLELGFAALDPQPTAPVRRSTTGEVPLSVGGGCNNGCVACVWTRRLDFSEPITLPLAADVAGKRVVLAGREPTLRADLPELMAALKAAGAAAIELETNGRRLTTPRYIRSLMDAGLSEITVKLFATTPEAWDRHTEATGSFFETLRALALVTLAAPSVALRALVVPGVEPGTRLGELLAFASDLGIPSVRVALRLAKLDLLGLERLAAEVQSTPRNVDVRVN